MIIQLAALSFFILVGGAVKFLLPNFGLYLYKYTGEYCKDLVNKKAFHNTGEYIATFLAVFLIAILSFIFYKFLAASAAYLMTENLTSFFTVLRGVYTIREESGVQSPFSPVHFWSGYIIIPAIQFISIYGMHHTIRYFMVFFNRNFMADHDQDVFEENDLLYFTCLGTGLIIWVELTFYSQSISLVSEFAHFVFLSFSVLGFICYCLSISHIHLLEKDSYKAALSKYFEMSSFEKSVIYSPKKIIAVTYLLGFLLHIPVNTGPQFLYSNFLIVLTLSLCVIVFYTIGKKWQISKIYNFLGTAMMYETLNMRLNKHESELVLINKGYNRKLIWGAGISITLFLVSRFELTFFVLFGVLVTLILPSLIILSGYCIGLVSAYIRTKYYNRKAPLLRELAIYDYLQSFSSSFAKSTLPMLGVIFGVFVLFSTFPKKYEGGYQQEGPYVNSVFGEDGNPLFIEQKIKNGAISLSNEKIPEFLLKLLYIQEDRDFTGQNNWFPPGIKWSNWHGISLPAFYRYFLSGAGGSNLNMQLIKNNAFPDASYPRDIQRKFAEMVASYQLSLQLSPKEIVTEYLNKVGMSGGRGYLGLMAASLHVFSRPIGNINQLEMMYLVATLKNGNSFQAGGQNIPYSKIEMYKNKVRTTLLSKAKSWRESGLISLQEFRMLQNQDLKLTNKKFQLKTKASTRDFLIKEISQGSSGHPKTYTSTISVKNQEKIITAVHKYKRQVDNKKNGCELYAAALVVDVESGKILGHYGGMGASDLVRFGNGFPVGSLIKPFIITELLKEGFSQNVKLYDGPIKVKKTPQNYDHHYSYRKLGIRDIIKKSLNAPMVNIRQITDPIDLFRHAESDFNKMGIAKDSYLNLNDESRREHIVENYPIGSRNMTIYDIAQAYQALLNDGKYIELSSINKYYDPVSNSVIKVKKKKKQIYPLENAQAVKSILHAPLRKGGTADIVAKKIKSKGSFYAKTGTTENYQHGYTVFSDGDILVVSFVSYGKKVKRDLKFNDTPPIPQRAGGHSAGILAAYIYNQFN